MPTTYNLVPIPLWYMSDLVGQPLAGGYMASYRSLNKVIQKPVFNNASGQFAYPNPVFFDETGKAGPFFWASDEPYYLEFYDADGNLFFTIDNYGPGAAGGGGGGGTVTVNNFLENYVVNNDYTTHGGTTIDANGDDTFANIQSGTVIAPSNHHGLVKITTGFPTIPYVGPDIMFVRSNDSATDALTFATVDFALGNVPLTGDVTPEYYVKVQCQAAGNETLKAVQYPIVLHVKNLEQVSSANLSVIVWAKGLSGVQNLTMNLVQFFGTGSATTPVVTPIPINASPLTNSWQSYIGSFSIPSVGGKALGAGGDDAVYLQVCYPAGSEFVIYHTKPKFYLANVGSVFPEMQSYDYVDRIINSPRTGDARLGYGNIYAGWIAANDMSIGSATSGATGRANKDTWPLFSFLWNGVSNANAPVSGGRGVSAIADFAANKTLTIPKVLGRAIASMGLPSSGGQAITWALGQVTGEELHVLTVPELAAHTHTMQGTYSRSLGSAGSTTFDRADGGTTAASSTGSDTGHNTIQPTTYMNVFLKL